MTPETASVANAVLARLRAETRPHHDAIEAALELTSSDLILSTYRHTLARFHGFYRPLEAGLQAVGGWADRGLDLDGRCKTPLLEADLRALGLDPAALPVCTDLPRHATVAAAFGCLYVLEGATLGGQVISHTIQNNMDIRLDTGGRFFNGYGSRTGAMWQAFRAAVVAFAVTQDDQDEVVSAAQDTFAKMHHWTITGGDNP